MKRIISVIISQCLLAALVTPVFADNKITADEVKEMYESRMLLSRQDICDKILDVDVIDISDPLAGTRKVSEYVNPAQALIYTAQTLDDDFEEYEVYCIHAWDNDEDRRLQRNIKFLEIPADIIQGRETNNAAFISSYYIDHEQGTFEGEVGTHGLPVRETDYEKMAEKINKYNDKGKITAIYFVYNHGYMVTANGIDYMVIDKEEYPPYDKTYGLVTPEEAETASLRLMDDMDRNFQDFLNKKRALTPNLSEVERETVDCEPTHYLEGYKNASAPFDDIKDQSKNMIAAVALLYDKGIINGYEDNTFRPDNTLTRGEAAVILSRLVRGEYDTAADFPDTENHWSRGAVNYLVSADIIHGYEDGLFRPDKEITYNEAINLVLSVTGYTGLMFLDKTIKMAMDEGFLEGLLSFADNTPIPRIEFARLIANAFDINMRTERVCFEAMGTAFLQNADITLGQYADGQEPVNGILFRTPQARQQWEWAYEDEFFELYDSIVNEELKQAHLDAKAKRQQD